MNWLDKFIVSERGQWEHPGKLTLVPTGNGKITTRGVKNDLIGIDNLGNMQYMTPENEYQFEGNMVYEIPMAYGGDISIPDLSRPNWLDKAQKGQQVKYYDDPLQFKKANKAYKDSFDHYLSSEKWVDLINSYEKPGGIEFNDLQKAKNIIYNEFPHVYEKSTTLSPKWQYPYNVIMSDGSITGPVYTNVYKKPTQKPVYKEKPKGYIPTKTVKLEREPIQLVMPQSDRTLMPYNNTMQVLRGIQQEDRDKQGPKVVPAPDFRHGGWLDKYQGDKQPSQVAANLPWLGNKGQILTEQEQEEKLLDKKFGIGPTVDKAEAVKAKENLRKTKRIETPLPSGAITPAMGPVEYALMAPVAGASAMKAAPIIGSALSTPLGLPGATIGNALGAYGATDALNRFFTEIPGQLSRGEYMDAAVNAATGALDVYGAGMVSPLLKGAKSAAGEAGKYLTTQTPLKNTYKYNPWAFKSNPEAYYRMIGDEGYTDALESGVIRANQKIPLADNGEPFGGMTTPEFDVPYFSKGRPWDETYQGPYMIEAKNVPMQGRSAYPETAYVPQNTIMSTDPNLNFYKQDWLRGYKKIDTPKQLPGSSNSSSVRSDISNFRDIANATREFGATDDEAIAAIEAIRSRKLSSWKTEEGRRRLQKLIDKDPNSFSLKSPFKNETPDTFIKRMENLVNSNVRLKNIKEEIPKLREQIIGYHKNMDEIDEAFNAKRISADDYFNMQKDLDEKIQRLGSKHDELYIETEPSNIAFIESTDSGQRVFLNPDLLSSADLAPTAAHEIAGHSLSNFTKYTRPTYLDEKLSGLKLKNPNDKTIDAITTFKPKGESNLFYHANYPGSLADNQNYWLSGSSGTERVPFVTELKEDMFTKGIIKNDYDVITPEMIQQHYNTYASKAGEKYPLRVYDIMEEDPKNFNLLSEVLNDLPSYAAPLTIGAGTTAALRKEKDGGWLDTYQDGGISRDRLKERLLNKYPGMQSVYGTEGENLNIIKDKGFIPRDYGYGDIEFINPGTGLISYTDDYQYQSPTPDMYTVVYNPRGANRKDIALDMLHGMRDDENYMKLLEPFAQAVKDARGNDMQYFYNEDLMKGFAEDGQDSWNENYIDGLLRAELAGYMARGRKDYKTERQAASPEMIARGKDIYNYVRGKREKGGAIATDNQDYNYIKYKDLSLSKGTGWLDNYK